VVVVVGGVEQLILLATTAPGHSSSMEERPSGVNVTFMALVYSPKQQLVKNSHLIGGRRRREEKGWCNY